MRVKVSLLTFVFLLSVSVRIASAYELSESLAIKAASKNSVATVPAIEELRLRGPAGMQALMLQYRDEIDRRIANPTLPATAEWRRITAALDAVSQQRNSYLSGLYWYTDINQAREVSKQTGKPILSLRLLGKLTDELSCANSRFFRTVLYSNETVSAKLREHFVLHWQSFSSVPLITIDFGDGRKLQRTITGNSIHYVLDSDGRVVEAIPGLYGPQTFLRVLSDSETLVNSLRGKSIAEKQILLADYYKTRINKISLAWLDDVTKVGKKPKDILIQIDEKGTAIGIASLAVTKMVAELPALRAMNAGAEALGRIMDEPTWLQIANLHRSEAELDDRSIGLMKKQNPDMSEDDFAGLKVTFQTSLAMDTVRNEYRMHTRLLSWLSQEQWRNDVDKLNDKVYAEMFFTPKSDPWFGLLVPGAYNAIDNGGVVK